MPVTPVEHFALKSGGRVLEFDLAYPLTQEAVLHLLNTVLQHSALFPVQLYRFEHGVWEAVDRPHESALVLIDEGESGLPEVDTQEGHLLAEAGEVILGLYRLWLREHKTAEIERKKREARRDPSLVREISRHRELEMRLAQMDRIIGQLTPAQRQMCRRCLEGRMEAEKCAQELYTSSSTLYRQARDMRIALAYGAMKSLSPDELRAWFAEAGFDDQPVPLNAWLDAEDDFDLD